MTDLSHSAVALVSAIPMNRSSIVAIVLFAAALLALFSIGPQATRKIQATLFQVISPFLKTGSGLEKQITSVRAA